MCIQFYLFIINLKKQKRNFTNIYSTKKKINIDKMFKTKYKQLCTQVGQRIKYHFETIQSNKYFD